MTYSQEFIDTVKNASNIVAVASRYMPLKQKGRQWWACCPFHHEKTASFAIDENAGFYHCFGCKESGNVFKLVEKLESVNFIEAVELLAKWANIKLPEQQNTPEAIAAARARQNVLEILDEARNFYKSNLTEEGKKYLFGRGITTEIIEMFNIGQSPDWDSLIKYFRAKGYTDGDLLNAGVASKNDKGRLYDAMAERIVFSIFDLYGNCIGFTGRVQPQKDNGAVAKYRNTAQTMVFDKGKICYGGDVLKKHMRTANIEGLIVVEGNVDCITLVANGFPNTVACMGTALTVFHAKAFKRFSPDIYLCLDGDTAGRKATIRAMDILRDEPDLNVRVISLPDGVDPDGFVRKNGAEAFKELVRRAVPFIDFKLDTLAAECKLDDNIGKAKYLKAAIEFLQTTIKDKIEVELYAPKVAGYAGVTGESVVSAVLNKSAPPKSPPAETQAIKPPTQDNKYKKAYDFVCASILNKKKWVESDKEFLFKIDFDPDDTKLIGYGFFGTNAELEKQYADSICLLETLHFERLLSAAIKNGDISGTQEYQNEINKRKYRNVKK
jgi:DNA primase